MKNLLIVEDNLISGSLISAKLSRSLNFNIHWAKTRAEAISLLNQYENNFFAALLDYVLPDAPQGEIIDEVVSRNISSIVFTATVTKEVREKLWQKGIVDYVIKGDAQSIDYLAFILSRLEKNRDIQTMVVDDSKVFRAKLSKLLRIQNYQVFEAADGIEAIKLFKLNPGIKLVLIDYMMPNMDGFTLTRRLRKRHGRDRVVILGMTATQDKMAGAQFVKSGANDFIDKRNFIAEELYCRVNLNIENLESVQLIQKLATIDHLSGLYNRRHFYELADKLYSSAVRNKISIASAILDVDHFKQINDTYGHSVGDQALKHLSNILIHYFQRSADLVGRIGGEEFCILANNLKPNDATHLFERLRQLIENSIFFLADGNQIRITVSIGVCTQLSESLDMMLNQADEFLYEAKRRGRNRVVIDYEATENNTDNTPK